MKRFLGQSIAIVGVCGVMLAGAQGEKATPSTPALAKAQEHGHNHDHAAPIPAKGLELEDNNFRRPQIHPDVTGRDPQMEDFMLKRSERRVAMGNLRKLIDERRKFLLQSTGDIADLMAEIEEMRALLVVKQTQLNEYLAADPELSDLNTDYRQLQVDERDSHREMVEIQRHKMANPTPEMLAARQKAQDRLDHVPSKGEIQRVLADSRAKKREIMENSDTPQLELRKHMLEQERIRAEMIRKANERTKVSEEDIIN